MADLPGIGGSAWPDAGTLEAWVPVALPFSISNLALFLVLENLGTEREGPQADFKPLKENLGGGKR